ncbi:MAG: TetR family transcriptional regulator [Betaproteobacteria bacterium SG8_39]|nr:MAG: TetR family transcriptional regulator [Betaproteobacteria bacterium SG8_39]
MPRTVPTRRRHLRQQRQSSPPKARVQRGRGDANRRDALLRVCAHLFREKGFDGTTIRDISKAAGMHSGSPFYHFKTKQAMLVAVMEQGLVEGLRKTEGVMALALPPREKFERMIRAHLDTIFGPGNDFIPVLLYDWRSVTSANRARIIALRDRYDALWQQMVDTLAAAGLLRGDRKLARLFVLGAINWSAKWYRPGGRASLDHLARAATELFLRPARPSAAR